MNKAPRGQALIVMLIFLFVLIPLFVYLFDLGIVQYSKIRRQKQLDGISLDLATSQARALNAIAALNQGLEIAENRGYLMAASVAGLSACSFFNPKCAQILSRLLPKVRPFYKKLNKLGSHLAKQQDKILEWANKIQFRTQTYYQLKYSDVTLFFQTQTGDTLILPIERGDHPSKSKDFPHKREFDSEHLMKCHQERFTSPLSVSKLRLPLGSKQNVSIRSFYTEPESQFIQSIDHDPDKPIHISTSHRWPVGNETRVFYFSFANTKLCRRFDEVLGLNLSMIFDVPKPYVFKKSFFKANRFLVALASKAPTFEKKKTHYWDLSESHIDGADLNEMEFIGKLDKSSSYKVLWPKIATKARRKLMIAPNLRDFSEAH